MEVGLGKWHSFLYFKFTINAQHASEDVVKMLIGNKCDRPDRVVPKERGERIAAEHSIRFLETSAKANINIEEAFYQLAESIMNRVLPNS
jgi:GTPase SAR1 family protein